MWGGAAVGVHQLVECLPQKLEAIDLIPSTSEIRHLHAYNPSTKEVETGGPQVKLSLTT